MNEAEVGGIHIIIIIITITNPPDQGGDITMRIIMIQVDTTIDTHGITGTMVPTRTTTLYGIIPLIRRALLRKLRHLIV